MTNLGPTGQVLCFDCLEPKVQGSTVSSPRPRPNQRLVQKVHGRVSPLTHTRCYPVALSFKPKEMVSNLGPTGHNSCFESNRTLSLGVRSMSHRPKPNKRFAPACRKGVPSNNN